MRNPERYADADAAKKARGPEPTNAHDITRDERGFTVLLRNALFRVLRALSARDYAQVVTMLAEGAEPWTVPRFEAALAPYYEEHAAIRTDPAARAPKNTIVRKHPERGVWEVDQIIADDAGDDDWMLECAVDLERSRGEGRPVVELRAIRS
jgi:hypothetical protein